MIRSILVACLLVGIPLTVWGQPAFEVASVKVAPPSSNGGFRYGMSGGPGTSSPGRISAENYSLKDLILKAYGVPAIQVSGPEWLASARFDVVATVPAHSTKEQVPLMWQALLKERFKLEVHQETKESPLYALTVGKNGHKLKPSKEGPAGSADGLRSGNSLPSNGNSGSGSSSGGATGVGVGSGGAGGALRPVAASGQVSSDKMTMAALCESLSRRLDRPLVDQTGLTGNFEIHMKYYVDYPSDGGRVTDDTVTDAVFAAVQEQLGLKVESKKGPVSILVIDHVEKSPIEN